MEEAPGGAEGTEEQGKTSARSGSPTLSMMFQFGVHSRFLFLMTALMFGVEVP